MAFMSVEEAAKQLGVVPQRVRALIHAGRLRASKLGRAWVMELEDVRALENSRHPGRPVSAANAWAVLALLGGSDPSWVDPAVRSRLRRRMRDASWVEEALLRAEQRSNNHSYRFLPADIPKIGAEYGVVLTGLAAPDPDLDVVVSQNEFDGYVKRDALADIQKRFHPSRASAGPNALLRVPSHPWVLKIGRVAPAAVKAADLLDHEDPRVARAARNLLRRLLQ
jgi:excisionase family DNA binding protein